MSTFLRYAWLLFLIFNPIGLVTAQSVTLYCLPAPHKIKWKSPHTLLVSTARNYISTKNSKPVRPLGHIMVELKKDSSYLLTGMSAKYPSDVGKNVMRDKEGLGILFKVVEGQLEETKKIKSELESRIQSGKAAFITYNISDSAYEYLRLYLQYFKLRGYDKIYNGNNLPRMGEGSGCSAFAISFLELINALLPEYTRDWKVNVDVPDKLIGSVAAGKKISWLRVLLSFRWAKKNEPFTSLELYDPSLMYEWINAKWKQGQGNTNTTYTLAELKNAKGLEIQCNDCLPQSPMFTNDTVSAKFE